MKNNFHKVRGKREFLFDDKELLMLSGGAIIICVLIFVLGLMIGQSLEAQSVASPLVAGNSPLENDLDTGEQGFAANGIEENQQDLTSPHSSPETQKAERSYYTVLPDKETYVEVEATPVREEASETALVEQPQEAVQQEETPKQAVKEETPVPPALPNVPNDPADEMRVGRQPQNIGLNEPVPDGVIYSVQVASSPSREDSERLVRKYAQDGYQAYVMVANLDDKGIWYRVRVGNLPTRQAANQLREELLSKIPDLASKQPFVIKVTE